MTKIDLNHGAGGRQMQTFIKKCIVDKLSNGILERLDDCAILENKANSRLAMTSDSFVVSPLFFEGGDIGRLCIAGTANDLATSGAQVYAMSLAFILEEGTDIDIIERVTDSIAMAAKEAGVKIVTGDTKVVEKGKGDSLFINTCAVGFIPEGVELSSYNAKDGDVVMVTGALGNHEIALMKARKLIDFDLNVQSDVAPLNKKVEVLIQKTKGQGLHVIKDPTRGGLASALTEIAEHSEVEIILQEEKLPIDPQVRAVCELAGLDPLYLSNEGKYVIVCSDSNVTFVSESFPSAVVIGRVIKSAKQGVYLETSFGALRRVGVLETVQLPRIC